MSKLDDLNTYQLGVALATRIVKATDVAANFGSIDGGHHKQWVIDQMLRELLPNGEYEQWLSKYTEHSEEWDTGITP